jgi:hypothetical protein
MSFITLRTKYLMLKSRIEWLKMRQWSDQCLIERYESALNKLSSYVARRNKRENRGL